MFRAARGRAGRLGREALRPLARRSLRPPADHGRRYLLGPNDRRVCARRKLLVHRRGLSRLSVASDRRRRLVDRHRRHRRVAPSVPPPHATRLALVAREALRRRGAADPQAHIMLVAHNSPASRRVLRATCWSSDLPSRRKKCGACEKFAHRQRLRGSAGSRRNGRFARSRGS